MEKRLLFLASWRYIITHPLQFFLAILGIAMGVAVVIAIDLASSSAEKAFVESTEIFSGNVTHKIENNKKRIAEEQFATLKQSLPQLSIAPIIEQTVEKFIDDVQSSKSVFKVFGFDPFSESGFRDFSNGFAQSGDNNPIFSLLTKPNSVVISSQTAKKHNLQKDSIFKIVVNGKTIQLTVLDVLKNISTDITSALDDVLLMDISVAQHVLGLNGYLSRLEINSTNDVAIFKVSTLLMPGNHLVELENPGNALSQMTSAFQTNLQAMSLLAVMVGMFLIYNTMTFSVIKRRDVFANLRAIGVTRKEIFSVVLFEALVIGIIGTVLGLLLGMLLGKGLLLLVVRTINDLYFDLNLSQLSISPFSLLKGLFLGIVATLVSAWIPLREAFKTTPRENQNRSQLELHKKANAPKFAFIGILLFIMSVSLLFTANQSLMFNFFLLYMVLMGYALMIPIMVIYMIKMLRPMASKYLGNIAAMSLGNITNSLSRTGVAMTALTLAVATTIGVMTMVGSFRFAVQDWLSDSLKENVYFTLSSNISPNKFTSIPKGASNDSNTNLHDTSNGNLIGNSNDENITLSKLLETHPDVTDISIRLWTKVRSEVGKKSTLVQEIPGHAFDKYKFLGDTSLATFDRYQNQDTIIISEPLANKHNLNVGDSLKLFADKGNVDFHIIGIYRDYSSDQGVITISRQAFSRHWLEPEISSFGVFLSSDVSPDDFIVNIKKDILRYNLDNSGSIDITSNDKIFERSLNVFDQTFAITNVLRILTIIVAFIGILSAFLALQLERGVEFATLRAIGLTPWQVWQSMLAETAVMGCIAGVLAIPLGIILSAILILVINIRSFGWSMEIYVSGSDLLFAITFSVVAATLAGLYPAYKMSKQAPAALLRSE